MTNANSSAGFRPVRRDQLRQEQVHDAYHLKHKLSEPTVCPSCGAVYHGGRWQWVARPANAQEVLCAACHRIKDGLPAGFVHVGGSFFAGHREEMLGLLRHHEEKAKGAHALARIMAIEDEGDGVLVTTTDIHLARDLGEALHHAYQGELEFHYNDADNLLRVHWHR